MSKKRLIKLIIDEDEEKNINYLFVEKESELAELEAVHAKKKSDLFSFVDYRYEIIEIDLQKVEMQELEGLKLVDFVQLLKLVEKHEWMK